jgi:high-affinity Fe2+/Pb2+ permease
MRILVYVLAIVMKQNQLLTCHVLYIVVDGMMLRVICHLTRYVRVHCFQNEKRKRDSALRAPVVIHQLMQHSVTSHVDAHA